MVGIVTLVSGGLDSTVMAALAVEQNQRQFPLFIDYGQKARDQELAACRASMARLSLPDPRVANLSGFGELVRSGLTDDALDVVDDAFTPGRNALFLLIAGAYAMTCGAEKVAIGLLDEKYHLFPDQTRAFIHESQEFLYRTLGRDVAVVAPLMGMSKSDVVRIAKKRGLFGQTYSCHQGNAEPCGRCIACLEFEGTED